MQTGSCASLPSNETGSGFKPRCASYPCYFQKEVVSLSTLRGESLLCRGQLSALGVALLCTHPPFLSV